MWTGQRLPQPLHREDYNGVTQNRPLGAAQNGFAYDGFAFNVIVSGARTQNERDSQFKRPVHIFSWIEACFMFQFQAFPGSAVLRGRLHLFA